ncbi:unnamed protein product [Caenorhabditis bovis]|uniref:Uncharacterized protein n=1 Tax=Caenorhabditis bovis TaxID=2654633 RepID=A0A8S1EEF8_9PELO|nr:unnamed protein product [Caenorhabditis bovis]
MFEPFNLKTHNSNVPPVAEIKPGKKWIVVTSISGPTNDIKRLSSFADWNLVVVADTKTPTNWSLPGVHFLSVDYQKTLPFSIINYLPYKSYTRKNIGYLYAISHGAEWIYDTDDDNKPYGKGLDQFDYTESVSGVRFFPKYSDIRRRLFNPYSFFGMVDMWPRGFPLESLKSHTNGGDRMTLCTKMPRASVQQGLVHHDPDVDAIYRLLNADPNSGLDVKFNEFAPPITLAPRTYSPWNSQNTLFHKSAFHTLFLPTTVSFRTTDIWRSYFAQAILHLSGLSVAFVPVNAVQFRNAHDYLKDFNDEQQVYKDAGKMVDVISKWNCTRDNIEECMEELAVIFAENELWKFEDAQLIKLFIKDLKMLKYEFPNLSQEDDQLLPSQNESDFAVNCRRISLNYEVNSVSKQSYKLGNYDQFFRNLQELRQKWPISAKLKSGVEKVAIMVGYGQLVVAYEKWLGS